MKNKIFIIAVVSILILGAVVFYRLRLGEKLHPEVFLPDDTLVYLNWKNSGDFISSYLDEPLAENMGEIDFVKLMLDLDFSFENADRIRRLRDFVQSPAALFFFDEFLSKEFTLSLLSKGSDTSNERTALDRFLIFCKPKHPRAFIKMLLNKYDDKASVKTTQYGQHVIERVTFNGDLQISFVYTEAMVLVCTSEDVIREALDRFDEGKENLGENYFFQDAISQHPSKKDFFCLYKIDKILQQFVQKGYQKDDLTGKFFKRLDKWKGFTTGSFSATPEKNSITTKLKLHYNPTVLNRNTTRLLSLPPGNDPLLHVAPEDSYLYYWANTFELKTMWDIYTEDYDEGDMVITDFKKGVELSSGVEFFDFLELIDTQVNVILREVTSNKFDPLANISLVFHLKDVERVAGATQNFLEKSKIPHTVRTYKNVKYTFWGNHIQKGLQPVYAIQRNHLYISSSVKMLTGIIDTMKNKRSLEKASQFTDSAENLLGENNSFLYVELPKLIELSKKLTRWGSTMLAIQNRKAADKSKILIDRFIFPVFDGIKEYPTFSSRSYSQNGVVTIEGRLVLGK